MVDIISKRAGPREEDKRIKQFLTDNHATITRLADHLSGGTYAAGRLAPQAPPARDAITRHIGAASTSHESLPRLRVSPNGRVVVMDQSSGRQLHHLGEIRGAANAERFVLATAENGFIAPLDASIAARLLTLDQQPLNRDYSEADLIRTIEAQLGLV